jgi:hypothetical protein
MSSRTTRAALQRAQALALPDDLWIEILARVPAAGDAPSLGRALASTKWMHALTPWAWRGAVFARWPAWAAVAAGAGRGRAASSAPPPCPVPCWRRLYDMFALRQREMDAAQATAAAVAGRRGGATPPAEQDAGAVTPRHRAVLVEWLAEVRGRRTAWMGERGGEEGAGTPNWGRGGGGAGGREINSLGGETAPPPPPPPSARLPLGRLGLGHRVHRPLPRRGLPGRFRGERGGAAAGGVSGEGGGGGMARPQRAQRAVGFLDASLLGASCRPPLPDAAPPSTLRLKRSLNPGAGAGARGRMRGGGGASPPKKTAAGRVSRAREKPLG